MKPAPFEYFAPGSLDEALELLAQWGSEARPLAGGQSLVPAMNFRLARPAVLVDLNAIPGLSGIEAVDGGVRIGALARQRAVELSDLVERQAPLLHETMPYIAHVQIRNRGTIGGSLAHADPAAELPAVALALDVEFHIANGDGERSVTAADFYTGLFETALEPEDLLVGVTVPPLAPGTGWSFLELSRRHGDYALVGVAATVTLGADGRCEASRVALLSVGDGPVLAEGAAALSGEWPARESLKAVAHDIAYHELDPPGDVHASVAFRRHLADTLVLRALKSALERAGQQLSPTN